MCQLVAAADVTTDLGEGSIEDAATSEAQSQSTHEESQTHPLSVRDFVAFLTVQYM